MKKTVNPLLAFAFVVMTITCFHAWKKSSDGDCRTCKALSPDNGVVDEAQICNESQETAFRNSNPGTEIVCD
mgnify:CR=1 FL=1